MGQHLTEMVGCCTQFLRPPGKLDGLKTDRPRKVQYLDAYYDTAGLDLHGSGLLLRSRSRNEGIDFLDFKGAGRYLGVLLSREFASDRVLDEKDLRQKLQCSSPSAPVQALYSARSDLLGQPLHEAVRIKVNKTTVDVVEDGQNIPVAALSFHQYEYLTKSGSEGPFYVVELQPKGAAPGNAPSTRLELMSHLASILEAAGYMRSPSTKYHRAPRSILSR